MKWLKSHPKNRIALISDSDQEKLTYLDLYKTVKSYSYYFSENSKGGVALVNCNNSISSICAYLASLDAGIPLIMGEQRSMQNLIEKYQPEMIIRSESDASNEGYGEISKLSFGSILEISQNYKNEKNKPHKELALMLSTSGSTGTSKVVRLSLANLETNARSIIKYLMINSSDRSIQSLPLSYSYGLSLLNSHLIAGATTILTKQSFMLPEFWKVFDEYACTSFSGVPYIYEVLNRLKYDLSKHKSLRYCTQAGGALAPNLIKSFANQLEKKGKKFFIMYGQTEATARISYVPPDKLIEKLGSIGLPIPGGSLDLIPLEEDISLSQLQYTGPNVMLGYAENRSDLAKGDEMGGVLLTGDLARVDDEGYYYLLGRLKRFAKLFGRRINLMEVEQYAEEALGCRSAAIEKEGKLKIYFEGIVKTELFPFRLKLAKFLNLTPSALSVESISEIPLTSSGKKNYQKLN